jgi:hypothetical protein
MTTAQQRLSKTLSGVAGEYFVAAELSRRGYVASLTLKNTQGIDVLAASGDASRSVGIQVKTNQDDAREWLLDKKVESQTAPNIYFVFVALGAKSQPRYHVVPSRVVAEYCARTHKEWLSQRGRGGRKHRDNAMRVFKDPTDKYLNKWDLLGLD